MKKQQLAAILLMSVLLFGCAGGTNDTETVSPEESARLESLAFAEAQAQSEQLAEESRLAEEESRKLAEEEAAALLQKQLEEDRAMAERDFEENRYRTIHDVIELELTFMDSFNGHYLDETKWAYCPNWERDDCIWTEDAAYLRTVH